MLKISIDHPHQDEELTLAKKMLGNESPENVLASGSISPVLRPNTLAELRQCLMNILIKEELISYIVDIVRSTRKHQSVLIGASPRATQALLLSSRAFAAIEGRDFVTPDDIKHMAVPVLEHRLILRPEYEVEGLTVTEVIHDILQNIAIPR